MKYRENKERETYFQQKRDRNTETNCQWETYSQSDTEKIINETKPSFTLPKKTSGKTHNKNPKRILFRKKSIAF